MKRVSFTFLICLCFIIVSCGVEKKTVPKTEIEESIEGKIDMFKKGISRDEVVSVIGEPLIQKKMTDNSISSIIVDHYYFEKEGFGYIFVYEQKEDITSLIEKRKTGKPIKQ